MSAPCSVPTADGPWLFTGPAAARCTVPPPDAVGLPVAVLFDRDGTLVADVPYNGDPSRVVPMPSVAEALAAVRALGIPVGVVSNQSGVARGLLTYRQVAAVQRRIDALLGPFAVWAVCPHGPDDGCGCRKPAPGLVLAACDRLGVCPARTAVIGDIGSDVDAATAAGSRGVLVPTAATRPEEVTAAHDTALDVLGAVRLVLDPTARCRRPAPQPHRGGAKPLGPGPATSVPGAPFGPATSVPGMPVGSATSVPVTPRVPATPVTASSFGPATCVPGMAFGPGAVAAANDPAVAAGERADGSAARPVRNRWAAPGGGGPCPTVAAGSGAPGGAGRPVALADDLAGEGAASAAPDPAPQRALTQEAR